MDWSYSQNIGSNTSTVTAILKVQSMGYGNTNGWQNKSAGISINGNNMTYTINPNMGPNQTKELARRSYTFEHNGDGTKSVNISANVNYTGIKWNGGNLGNVTVGGNATLKTIARSSTVSMDKSSAILGETSVKFTINRSSSSFKHDIYWSWDKDEFIKGRWDYISGGNKTSASYLMSTIPLSPILPLMPSSSSTFIYIYIDTFNGDTRIGRRVRELNISIPDNIKPSVGYLSSEEIVDNTKSILGTSGSSVKDFVQGKSSVKVGVYGVLMGSGSHLQKYEYYTKLPGKSEEKWGQNMTGWYTFDFEYYSQYAGDIELISYTYDTRGRWSRTSINIKLHEYSPPRISRFTTERVGDQKTIRFSYSSSASSIVVGGVERNRVTSQVQSIENKKDDSVSANWWRSPIYNTSSQTIDIGGYSTADGFKTWVGVFDSFGGIGFSYNSAPTAYVVMAWRENKGVGFGKLHEKGAIDVHGDIYLDGGKLSGGINGLKFNDEDVVGYGKNSNGEYIWFYDGTMICWKNYVQSTSACNTSYGSVYSTSNQSWTFPSAFYDYPTISITPTGEVPYSWGAFGGAPVTRTFAQWIVYAPISSSSKPFVSLFAIGRYKA